MGSSTVSGALSQSEGEDACEVVGERPECAVGICQGTVVLVWRTAIIVDGARWVRHAFEQLAARGERNLAFMTVIEKDCDPSTSSDVRNELADVLAIFEDRLRGAAITFECVGFRATLLRSAITAINMASRARFPNSVFGDSRAATEWLCKHAGQVGS